MKKDFIEDLQFIGFCVMIIAICFLGLKALDTHEKERALDRCFPNEIVQKQTPQGDKYYGCKVDK